MYLSICMVIYAFSSSGQAAKGLERLCVWTCFSNCWVLADTSQISCTYQTNQLQLIVNTNCLIWNKTSKYRSTMWFTELSVSFSIDNCLPGNELVKDVLQLRDLSISKSGNSRDLVLICQIKWMLSFHTLDIWLKKQFTKEIFRQLEMRKQNYAWVQAWKNNGIHWIMLWRSTTFCAPLRISVCVQIIH